MLQKSEIRAARLAADARVHELQEALGPAGRSVAEELSGFFERRLRGKKSPKRKRESREGAEVPVLHGPADLAVRTGRRQPCDGSFDSKLPVGLP
jgi:hypothetical protein